jgi:hypothetical protein
MWRPFFFAYREAPNIGNFHFGEPGTTTVFGGRFREHTEPGSRPAAYTCHLASRKGYD